MTTETKARVFPVLWQGDRNRQRELEAAGCPRSVPWAFIDEHGAECLRWHDQTPQRLAERGGLAPEEMLVVLGGPKVTYDEANVLWHMHAPESVPKLLAALDKWKRERLG